ncbi:MAG: peptidase S1, partial [Chloroflexi bacterium]
GQRILIGGDVITALDDQETDSMETLQSLLQETEPGQEITLTLLREGKEHTVPVTLGERPAPS